MVYVSVQVNEKGQIVIPKILRDAYGIKPGSEVLIREKDNALVLERRLTQKEFAEALAKFPKIKAGKINSDADYAEELEERWTT